MPTGLPGPSSMNSTFGSLSSSAVPFGLSSNFVTPDERRRYDREQTLLAQRGQGFHVMFEQRLERLLRLPFRVLRRHRLYAIKCEGKLEIERLFAPQRAIVVERCDAQLGRHEIRRPLRRHPRDEIHDRLLRRAFVPGGKGDQRPVRRRCLPDWLQAASPAARRLKRSQRIKTLEAPSCS